MLETLQAHDTDVNVITWSSMLGHMLASGADNGTLRAWDLRTFAQGKHLGEFRHHKCAPPPSVQCRVPTLGLVWVL